jgi:hypothetical protein
VPKLFQRLAGARRFLPAAKDLQVLAGLAAIAWGGEQIHPGAGAIAVGVVLIYAGLIH